MDASPSCRLPRELRGQIYTEVLATPEELTVVSSVIEDGILYLDWSPLPEQAYGLMNTCKQLMSECTPIFYSTNTFVFVVNTFDGLGKEWHPWHEDDYPHRWISSAAEEWLEYIGVEAAQKLRKVNLQIGLWDVKSEQHESYSEDDDLIPNIGRFARHIHTVTSAKCSLAIRLKVTEVPFVGKNTIYELTLPTDDWKQAGATVRAEVARGKRRSWYAHAKGGLSDTELSTLLFDIDWCYRPLIGFVQACKRWELGETIPEQAWAYKDASPGRKRCYHYKGLVMEMIDPPVFLGGFGA